MAESTQHEHPVPEHRRYKWPWFVLALFVAAILLATLWLSVEIRRTQRIRDANEPAKAGTQLP